MFQILQNLRSGETTLAELPAPGIEAGHLLIRTRVTLVSQGTEKMLVQFGKASLFQKARSQPERVKQVLGKIRNEGLMPTLDAVFRKLDEPLPLGYCNAGVVVGVGKGVVGYQLGDRVSSNGPHAEFVSVPANLVAKIPDGVDDEAAAFTVIGAIGLQGVRLAQPEFGEHFVVVGLGLVGQLTAQLLRANGCRVIGFDFDQEKVEVARALGIEAIRSGGELNPVTWVQQQTSGLGADGVVITASTSSNDVIAQSAQMSRKRGRIVLVGVVGLNINRADFYEKEIGFRVSCSYGPGRYEEAYEEKGFDYPPGFVRWTENRNFQAVLAAMRGGALRVGPLITRRVSLKNYSRIYDQIEDGGLASLLIYDPDRDQSLDSMAVKNRPVVTDEAGDSGAAGSLPRPMTTLRITRRVFGSADGVLAVVGAGNFTKMTALPALAAAKAPIKTIVSSGGVTGTSLAKKYGVPLSSTDYQAVLDDPEVKGVVITTRHNLHAEQTIAALKAGKHVLVEKPLCLSLDELHEIEATLASFTASSVPLSSSSSGSQPPTVTVGFNRRFSPHVRKIRTLLGERPGPLSIVATMNAGAIPAKHWVHDPEIGGGRLVGEACHFVDLAVFITGSLVENVCATALGGGGSPCGDTASILLRHANGSTTVVNYLANGHRGYPKERIEIFAQERVLVLVDFQETTGHGFRSFSRLKTRTDKGHGLQFAEFARCVRENAPPLISWREIANVTQATLAIGESLCKHGWVPVSPAS